MGSGTKYCIKGVQLLIRCEVLMSVILNTCSCVSGEHAAGFFRVQK